MADNDDLNTAATIAYLLHNAPGGQSQKAREAVGEDPFNASPYNRTHEWRRHVPDEFVEVWADFTPLARAAVYFMASKLADNENWD